MVSWNAKCPIFKAIVAGFRGKVAKKNRTLGVPGYYNRNITGSDFIPYITQPAKVFFHC